MFNFIVKKVASFLYCSYPNVCLWKQVSDFSILCALGQVLALPLPHRPLFPGFYMPIYVKVRGIIDDSIKQIFFFF